MEYTSNPNKTNYLSIIIALLLGAGGTFLFFKYTPYGCGTKGGISESRCALKTAMRKLWSDHVFWTRLYIISATSNLPDIKETTNRLLKNQEDIGNAAAGFYGQDAGKKLTDLLKDHILIAADIVTQAKANNKEKMEESDKKWHKNAEDIAEFLSSANPNWPKQDLIDMLNSHLSLTTQEVVARLNKKWSGDIEAFDKIYNQILEMADALTSGIVKQFPEKF